ncbi:MAG TPA: ABC transporter substrate-binding protein, partial [Baekduia sp.]|nr:ABC transporter substrate-binding protein [Baekduia sp.]
MVRSWTVAGVVAAAVVLGACGSSSDSSSDSAAASKAATTAAAPKGTPIKVGLLVDASGPQNGGQGGAADVLDAWAKATNAAGGIAKHPVAIEVKDTAGSPSKAATAAQSLIGDKSVAAVVLNDAAADA